METAKKRAVSILLSISQSLLTELFVNKSVQKTIDTPQIGSLMLALKV